MNIDKVFKDKEKQKQFKKEFDSMKDNQDEVDETQFKKILIAVGIEHNDQQRKNTFRQADTDNDMKITIDELEKFVTNFNTSKADKLGDIRNLNIFKKQSL